MTSKFMLLTAAAALGIAGSAVAQGNGNGQGAGSPPDAGQQGIGQEVRDIAQDPERTGGIGPEVRDLARDRDLPEPPVTDPPDDDDDGDDVNESRGIGPDVREIARDADREGGIGEEARKLTQGERDETVDDDDDPD